MPWSARGVAWTLRGHSRHTLEPGALQDTPSDHTPIFGDTLSDTPSDTSKTVVGVGLEDRNLLK